MSKDEQVNGPNVQRDSITSWAEREGVRVVAWHDDIGVSGTAPLDERPGMLAALDALRAHGAGLLVVHRRDRLARDVEVALAIEGAARKVGSRVTSVEGVGNGDSPADALTRTMLDGMAQYEAAIISARTKAALAAKRRRGERVGTVPFGFRATPDGRLAPHARERRAVVFVLAERAAGQPMRAIVSNAAAAGHVGRTGRPLALTQVAHIIRRGR